MADGNSAIYDQAKARVAMSTVAFISPPAENAGMESLGSATLARIGDHRGLVTAAHVASALERHDVVGLAQFVTPEGQDQRCKLTVAHCRPVAFGQPEWSPLGPDLAFLALPFDTAGALEAKGCVFINLDARQRKLSDGDYDRRGFWLIAGAVGERFDAHEAAGRSHVSVQASVEPGVLVHKPLNDGFDGYEFTPDAHPEYKPPSSYGGMSGGGLWLAHTGQPTGDVSSVSFLGVNFYEWASDGGAMTVICHGPISIYGRLMPAARDKLG